MKMYLRMDKYNHLWMHYYLDEGSLREIEQIYTSLAISSLIIDTIERCKR